MAGLEELKKQIKEEASENPEEFFATDVLREKGFERGKCENCGMHFWSTDGSKNVCGEPECTGGYTFINDSPADRKFSYVEAWKEFEKFMEERSYASIDRYPVVARWRDDVEFTGASIYCFQPHVVSGEAEPPADELVIPQPSLRFNDIDNVGITGRHYTNFTMIGQACFQPPEKYDVDRYFRDMMEFTIDSLGIGKEKLVFHEEAWGGGGNLGPCMECFVDGLELWNQVYMLYRQTPEGYEELDLQVLDMGMGHERITWISHGTETSYESVMPETLEKMKEKVGLEINEGIWREFLPYSSELNVDEVEDIEEKWQEIAEKMDVDKDKLKDSIRPAAALYSIAEHSRALNFALADGKIPSNTGGGHNLRIIYRRAMDFIEKYNWDLDMKEVAEWNARELEEMFPDLIKSIDEIKEILEVEEKKYRKSRRKAEKKLSEFEETPSVEKMIELYESHGVSPEMMEEKGFEVPEDFYMKLEKDSEEIKEAEEKFDLENIESTEKLYYDRREPYRDEDGEASDFGFEAKIIEIIDDNWILLDRTMFYPEGGGQRYDTGLIEDAEVKEVQKQSNVVLHRVEENHSLEKSQKIDATVNGSERRQLTQHHSSTHMVNAAAREELGEHIYQAGASKDLEKARLDLTHYEKPSQEEVDEIEQRVREFIEENHSIEAIELPKSEAEQKYGFRIYQGGAPPGNTIRLIDIDNVDIEACGGTHLTETGHAGGFVITGCTRIQDGVIRLEYKAGEAAKEYEQKIENIHDETVEMLYEERNKRDSLEGQNFREKREELREITSIYSVEFEEIPKTIERFQREIEENQEKIERLKHKLGENIEREENQTAEGLIGKAEDIFEERKETEKTLEDLESQVEEFVDKELEMEDEVRIEIPTENVGLLIQVARKLANQNQASVTLIGEKGAVSASEKKDMDARDNLREKYEEVQGDEKFAKAFN
jgi:alanyl-tRNA synthetase